MTSNKNETTAAPANGNQAATTVPAGTSVRKENNSVASEDAEAADAYITANEIDLLNNASDEEEQDDINEDNAQIDNTDEDGEPLNEGSDLSGGELDVPGAELDDADEAIGEEDEENNSYSGADQD